MKSLIVCLVARKNRMCLIYVDWLVLFSVDLLIYRFDKSNYSRKLRLSL